jgi:transcriptional regulator with XRE-family HTH domain
MPRTANSEITAKRVGASLRTARSDAGLSQRILGERMGASGAYIANVEAGRENLTLGQLANLAAALGAGLEVSFQVPERERVSVPDATR